MGDDTFGQCGQAEDNRPKVAPFFEKRYGTPTLVKLPEKIIKISTGYRHSLAVSDKGNLWVWGYNNQQQLSNTELFADSDNPSMTIFEPTILKEDLEGKLVIDAAAGEDFTVILTENIRTKL